ncbi:MAG: substrate-binding domain-containing protein [bacterium]|nr:substrate-binding domain-containing protein [bacterium]
MSERENNPAYPIIPNDREDDLHNLDALQSADLVLFMAGNQFMVMPRLMAAFRKRHPEVKTIVYETLPPGLELKQIVAGGALFRGKVIHVQPDIYASVSRAAMGVLERNGLIDPGAYRLYLHNRIVLMVPRGNPAGISTVADLGADHIRISQPNPEYEDIAHPIVAMYRQVGGAALVRRIMEEKEKAGTTLLTTVHHRETPERLLRGEADVGPVWATEFFHARREGLPLDVIEPGEGVDQRDGVNYYICRLGRAEHPESAEDFLHFVLSAPARRIYEEYGFVTPQLC